MADDFESGEERLYHLLYHSHDGPPVPISWASSELEASALTLPTGSIVRVGGDRSPKRGKEESTLVASTLEHVRQPHSLQT